MPNPNSLWSISPYLHHAISLRADGDTSDAGQALAINNKALATEAFGGIPTDATTLAAYNTVLDALDYYSAVFAAEPNLLKYAVRGIPPSTTNPPHDRSEFATPPKAILGVIDENVPLDPGRYGDRLASIWVQQGKPLASQDQWVPFGYEFCGAPSTFPSGAGTSGLSGTRLASDLAFQDYRLTRDKLRQLEQFSHGSAVLGRVLKEVDDRTPLAMVGLPSLAVRDTSGRLLPYFVITGMLYIMAVARRVSSTPPVPPSGAALALPVVINLSLGVHAGPKDGTGRLEEVFDALCDPALAIPDLGPVHLVVPMGNSRQARCRAVLPTSTADQDLGLWIQPDDKTASYVEMRTSGSTQAQLSISAPGSSTWTSIPVYAGQEVVQLPGHPGVAVYHEIESQPGGATRSLRILAFAPSVNPNLGGPQVPSGTWRLRVQSGSPEVTLLVQRDDSLFGLASGGRQAKFSHPDYRIYDDEGRVILDDSGNTSPITRSGTANAYASASSDNVWRVGGVYTSVSSGDPRGAMVPYSGLAALDTPSSPAAGDVLAPCEHRKTRFGIRAKSMGASFELRTNGTSMASPTVAALLARGLADDVPATGLLSYVNTALQQAVVPDPKGAHPY